MKKILLMTISFLTTDLFGQTPESLGFDNNPVLSKQESVFLNSLSKDQHKIFDFTNKKIAFVTGNTGNELLTKTDFFRICVKPYTDKGSQPQVSFISLTKEEQEKSGGYDALVLAWVKLFTAKQKRNIIEKLETEKK
ncbi:hypothetical protein [Chitinophaga eiseniae]|uniref:DUF8192 domain-containing protein n=1 Tax=Chitinophaga eiseniae TaxID=634771 RepID=A0A847STA8_9BACT|nr:hypothetical protein [Chitinophaga eiseniae]NLR81348.1 hypothetical protein [Chitinophaga eiseniae]